MKISLLDPRFRLLLIGCIVLVSAFISLGLLLHRLLYLLPRDTRATGIVTSAREYYVNQTKHCDYEVVFSPSPGKQVKLVLEKVGSADEVVFKKGEHVKLAYNKQQPEEANWYGVEDAKISSEGISIMGTLLWFWMAFRLLHAFFFPSPEQKKKKA